MTLYMTEIVVSDWPETLAWYRDVLGLPVELLDESRRFALLGGDWGRFALVGKDGTQAVGRHRLMFRVKDLDVEHRRLAEAGSSPGEIVEDRAEGYRAFRIQGPDMTPIRIFAWTFFNQDMIT